MFYKMSVLTIIATIAFGNAFAQKSPSSIAFSYDKCIEGNVHNDDDYAAKCREAEVKKLDAQIQKIYLGLLKKEGVKKWNNGNGMFRGNLKNTDDSFMAFRNNYCSFYNAAMHEQSTSKEFMRQDCRLSMTRQYLSQIISVLNDSENTPLPKMQSSFSAN